MSLTATKLQNSNRNFLLTNMFEFWHLSWTLKFGKISTTACHERICTPIQKWKIKAVYNTLWLPTMYTFYIHSCTATFTTDCATPDFYVNSIIKNSQIIFNQNVISGHSRFKEKEVVSFCRYLQTNVGRLTPNHIG